MLAITKYAERLDKDLDLVDYPERVKLSQKNWIGKSEGSEIDFKIKSSNEKIKVFTTRADTLFGVTYVVLAPEHSLVINLLASATNKKEVEEYIKKVKNKSDLERAEAKEKTGIELKGVCAINPANNEEVPVWIADYVLPHYGTGAVMAVPAHDERDFEFSKKYHLSMRRVVEPKFVSISGPSAVHSDMEYIPRNAVCVIVRNPKDGKYLGLSWKAHIMHGLVTGGIEEGEDLVQAAIREVHEETGYKNLKLVKDPNFALHSFFYHRIKGHNRWARFQYVFLDLIDEERDSVSEEELKVHEAVWVPRNELRSFFTVIEGEFINNFIDNHDYIFIEDGILHNSGKFSDLDSEEARKKITEAVGGKIITRFKLRDWIFSRQRYWGEPIPVINCDRCGIVPVPEKNLPVKLPEIKNYEPTDTGESPLSAISKWVNVKCPKCGGKARRETDTMPNWAGSSWYYLRYCDPKNKAKFADLKKLKYWTPVDWYNGGMEHTTLHLLYSRFWHKFLYDLKLVPSVEPYLKRTSHGMILGEGGVKMSKSLGNVVNPDEIVKTYGADTLRVYEMFMGPFEETAIWNTESIIGSRRFIEKVWRVAMRLQMNTDKKPINPDKNQSRSVLNQGKSVNFSLEKLLHKTIKKVGEDIETMRFNTAISAMMILATEMESSFAKATKDKESFGVDKRDFKMFLQILAPFAPHVAEELWRSLGEKNSIHVSGWPKWSEELARDTELKIIIQINGKVRAEMLIVADEKEEEIKKKAIEHPAVEKFIAGQTVKKIIYVKNKLVNLVV